MNPTNHYVFSGLTNCPVDTYDKLFNLPDLISSSVQWGNTINLTGLLWWLNKMIYSMYFAQCYLFKVNMLGLRQVQGKGTVLWEQMKLGGEQKTLQNPNPCFCLVIIN